MKKVDELVGEVELEVVYELVLLQEVTENDEEHGKAAQIVKFKFPFHGYLSQIKTVLPKFS